MHARLVAAAAAFVGSLVLGLAEVATAGESPATTTPTAARAQYDWGVAYFMSYDNNLEGCGQPIIEMIRKGVASTGEKTIAAVQADFTDAGGMHRYTIRSGGIEEARVPSDDSANEDRLADYLEWFAATFKCKRYVVTFLDHGGKIDEMCSDGQPDTAGKEWMSGRVVGERLRKVKAKLPGRWSLLFLQQCGRGSLENLYSFRGTADFVMSSPVPVGAPNTYYTALHEWLAANPDAGGDAVAAKIAEEDEHYTIYTCLRTEKLDELPKRLDAALKPLLAKKALAPVGERLRPIHPVGEPIVDAKTYLEKLAAANGGAGAGEVAKLFDWVKGELFTMVRFQNPQGRAAKQLCGLSIFAASSAEEAGRYAYLDLYKESRLGELWKKLVAGGGGGTGKSGGEHLFIE